MSDIKRISSKLTLDQVISEYKRSQIFLIKIPNSERLELDSLNKLDSEILKVCAFIEQLSSTGSNNKTLVVMGPMHLLPYMYRSINKKYFFKGLIALRLKKVESSNKTLPNEHIGALIMSTLKHGALNEVKKPYKHCKSCKDTVKDYGGKKYLLMASGTRISDVWTDILTDTGEEVRHTIAERLFRLTAYKNAKLTVVTLTIPFADSWKINPVKNTAETTMPNNPKPMLQMQKILNNKILNMDVLDGLRRIPDNAVDLALVDPPYNLQIRYGNCSDNMSSSKYVEWCKKWISEVSRTLRPGGILTLVNIPRWSLELLPYMQQKLIFHCWIVWDAFSYPYSPIIPAHYPILCFSKGATLGRVKEYVKEDSENYNLMNPLNYGYCIRNKCVKARTSKMNQDRRILSDLWTDIHRIRHNSFRYNHPTLMPQKLARRLILTFSEREDTVLDCFNGIGTTSLVSYSLGRKYIGIEKNQTYFETSIQRHQVLENGGNPFARGDGGSTRSSKKYRAVKPQAYVEKTLLLNEVKNVAARLGHAPSHDELKIYGKYPIKYYYNNFIDWAEITAITRRTGLMLGGQR